MGEAVSKGVRAHCAHPSVHRAAHIDWNTCLRWKTVQYRKAFISNLLLKQKSGSIPAQKHMQLIPSRSLIPCFLIALKCAL